MGVGECPLVAGVCVVHNLVAEVAVVNCTDVEFNVSVTVGRDSWRKITPCAGALWGSDGEVLSGEVINSRVCL